MDLEERKRARRLSIGNRELLIACSENDLEKIDNLLKSGVDINFKDRDGKAALHWAIKSGNIKIVEYLLSKGASPNDRSSAEIPLNTGKRTNGRKIMNPSKLPTCQRHVAQKKEPEHSQNSAAQLQSNNTVLKTEESMPEERKNSVHGNIYQLKLLMLFLYRGISLKYSFRLGTEIQEAKMIDDLIFEYSIKGKRVYRLLQAKHELDESKTINFGNLLTTDGDEDFSLIKYFFSYLALKKDQLFDRGLVQDVTVCTNIDFDIKNLESNGITVKKIVEVDKILDVKSKSRESARYNFSENIVELLKPKLKSYSSRRIITDVYTDDDVIEFIKRLVFAVNQPTEDELGHIVKNEICKEFDFITAKNVYNKFFTSMLNWLQGKEKGAFLSYQAGKEFFLEFDRNIKLWFDIKKPIESFSGRTDFLKDLHKLMCKKDAKDEKSKFVCISGLGGVGKSELARKYVSEYSEEYGNTIVWINAESYETLADSFRRLVRDKIKISTINAGKKKTKLNSIVEDVYAFFSDKQCLFVFDNAKKYKSQGEFDNAIEDFLPNSPEVRNHLNVLITSRNQKWPKDVVVVLPLTVFSGSEATEFVQKSLNLKINEQCQEVEKLVTELQFFPLALQQAVAYIDLQDEKLKNVGTQLKISNYLKKFREKGKKYLKFAGSNDNDYSKTTYSTCNIAIETIRQKEHGIVACEMLGILSYFAPADISLPKMKTLVHDEIKLASAIDLLKQYSIVNVENSKLSIHSLVLKVMRLHFQERKTEEEILHKALELFSLATLNFDNIEHAISVWNQSRKYYKLVNKFSSLPSSIVKFFLDSRRYEEAELIGIRISKELDAITPQCHAVKINLVATKQYTAAALLTRGKTSLSLNYYEDVYVIQRRIYGPNYIDTLETKNQMATLLTILGKHERALQLFEEIIAINTKSLGDAHLITLRFKLGKAHLFSNQGKYKEALLLLQKILRINQMILGENHQDCLNIKSSISNVLSRISKLDDAKAVEEAMRCVIELQSNQNDPENILVKTDRGIRLLREGQYKEAYTVLKQVYNWHANIFGEDNTDSLNIRRHLGESLRYLGKLDEALYIFAHVHKMQTPDSVDILKTKECIGHVFLEQGNYREALQFYKESLDMCRIIFGNVHAKTLKIHNYIAAVFLQQGKYDDTLRFCKHILEHQKNILGNNHPDTFTTKHIIATALYKKGELDEALKLYREIKNNEQNSTHPKSIPTKEKIVDILYKQKKYDEALQLSWEILAIERKALGEYHKNTIIWQHKISDILYHKGCHYKSLKILREISKIDDHEVLNLFNLETLNNNLKKLEVENALALTFVLQNNASELEAALNNGYDVNSADEEDDSTLLHCAISCNLMNIAEILVKNKADVNIVNFEGNTALHEAAIIGSLDAIKLLLKYGSIYNKRNKKNETPLDLCNSAEGQSFLKKIDKLFHDATKGNSRILEVLKNMKPDELEAVQEARNNDNKTLLRVVIANRHVDLSRKVLELIRRKE